MQAKEPAAEPRVAPPCPIGRAADVLGDRWTLLILRNATVGMTRFDDFKSDLGIADNILSTRLGRLVDAGLLTKVPYDDNGRRRHEYRLTGAGAGVLPLLHALSAWGQRHTKPGQPADPMQIIHLACGHATTDDRTCDHCGRPIERDQEAWLRPWRSATPFPLARPVGPDTPAPDPAGSAAGDPAQPGGQGALRAVRAGRPDEAQWDRFGHGLVADVIRVQGVARAGRRGVGAVAGRGQPGTRPALPVPRVPGCRESDPGYDHLTNTDELSFDQRGPVMSLVRVHNFSVSLDGFGTGAGQSLEAPFGHAGHRLVQAFTATRSFHSMTGQQGGSTGTDDAFASNWGPGIGAEIMGRNKFGPQRGPWTDEEWQGWWGEEPPFRTPVFVLTHHVRPPVEMKGGTTFHFINASPAQALAAARQAAGGLDVRIGGGPATVRQFLAADLIDHMHIALVPVLLGRGEPLWDGLEGLEDRFAIESVSSPSGITHLTFTRR